MILLHEIWMDGCGLYIQVPKKGHSLNIGKKVAMAPLTAISDKRILGAGLIMNGIRFMLDFDPVGVNPSVLENEGWVHRPTEIFVLTGGDTIR